MCSKQRNILLFKLEYRGRVIWIFIDLVTWCLISFFANLYICNVRRRLGVTYIKLFYINYNEQLKILELPNLDNSLVKNIPLHIFIYLDVMHMSYNIPMCLTILTIVNINNF